MHARLDEDGRFSFDTAAVFITALRDWYQKELAKRKSALGKQPAKRAAQGAGGGLGDRGRLQAIWIPARMADNRPWHPASDGTEAQPTNS